MIESQKLRIVLVNDFMAPYELTYESYSNCTISNPVRGYPDKKYKYKYNDIQDSISAHIPFDEATVLKEHVISKPLSCRIS
jgi:hypothetical protein